MRADAALRRAAQAIWDALQRRGAQGLRQQPKTAVTLKYLRLWQVGLLAALFVVWHVAHAARRCCRRSCSRTTDQAAFFFGEPLKIFGRIWHWFVVNADIYRHLWVTLLETVLAFAIGTVLGLGVRPVAGAQPDGRGDRSIPTSRR